MHVILTHRCLTLYRTMHSVYVLVLIKPLHPRAYAYSQTNPSPYLEEKAFHPVVLKTSVIRSKSHILSRYLILNLELYLTKTNELPFLSIQIQPDLQAVGFVKMSALQYSHPAIPHGC